MEQDEPMCSVPTTSMIALRTEGDFLVMYAVSEEGRCRVSHKRGIRPTNGEIVSIPVTKDPTIPALLDNPDTRMQWKAFAVARS